VPQAIDTADLEWTRVVLERRHWTILSVTVMVACTWALVMAAGFERTSLLWWCLALLTGASFAVWITTCHTLGQVHRQLRCTPPDLFVIG